MIAAAAANAAGADAGAVGSGAGSAGNAEGTTARDRARAARAESHAERALLEFVKDLVASFLADSFGLPSFGRVLRMFVRTGFPAAARRVVWKELGDVGLLHLLDPPAATAATAAAAALPSINSSCSPTRRDGSENCGFNSGDGGSGGGDGGSVVGDSCPDDAYLYPPDSEGVIIEAYLTALEHPRFGPTVSAGSAEGQRNREGGSQVQEGPLAAGAAAAPAPAPSGKAVRGEQGDASSIKALVSMREVAVHHLACYLFSPPRPRPAVAGPSAAAATCIPEGSPDIEGELSWQPDFGRRKTLERLLHHHGKIFGGGRGEGEADVAGSVATAVLGYNCRGCTSTTFAGGNRGGRGEGDGCVRTPILGSGRRKVLHAYWRAIERHRRDPVAVAVAMDGGGNGSSSGDNKMLLEEGGKVKDAVGLLATICS